MIDWHSHILPGMDDGSKDPAESLAMLQLLKAQGIETVVATPHFYANDENVPTFLARRAKALEMLTEQLPADAPKLRLGAEVRYYQGISRMEDLQDLRIEGSKLLLLEMPMSVWTEYMVRELIELSGKGSVKVVLAHVERYLKLQKQQTWERIADSGILMQVNGSFFTSLATRRKAVSLLDGGMIQLLGSDCHNMTSRPPQLGKALEVIRKRFGDDYLEQMKHYGYSLFEATNL